MIFCVKRGKISTPAPLDEMQARIEKENKMSDNCGLDRIFPINRSIFVHTWTYGIKSSASRNLKIYSQVRFCMG